MANMATVKREIAEAMQKETTIPVSPSAITKISDFSSKMDVYAAQIGSMTMLCWKESNGECVVQKVNW